MTAAELERLREELNELESSGRAGIAARIKTAREWGDLKENSEYHDAKNDQAHLETKIARLRERISTAVVVEQSETSDGAVAFGSTVIVREGDDGPERKWTIVGSHDASPSEGRLSAQSLQGFFRGRVERKCDRAFLPSSPRIGEAGLFLGHDKLPA